MADLELQHWNTGEFRLVARTTKGADWLMVDQAVMDNYGEGKSFSIGDSAFYPMNTQDMLMHEIVNEGLVLEGT